MKTATQIFRQFGPELTIGKWEAIIGGKPRLHHGDSKCNGHYQDGEGYVFLCRGKYGCKRWFCACDGGDGDKSERVLCSKCWLKYQKVNGGNDGKAE